MNRSLAPKIGEVAPSPLCIPHHQGARKYIPHPDDAFKVCALRKLFDSVCKKGMSFTGEILDSEVRNILRNSKLTIKS